ncbi:chemotaxis response regulator containing a CheY-like receiver domain and a methylesterase domain [Halobacteroides halobius DSM 5150]|uniref:Protein-glutamate methylesterase/protein-glutamine glutaminase n=1 Tax=Halobacteroides halobius (strain ATCC 35273 / DSM 5150 / MD-1) TaxID=748449 RepID=L0K6R9_HALHC|nr:chemotaxis response regulator protein-glutamate methylesterase [Halobacteroides halobius]AGB40962.1 chemotaxis response regulator containing a CheY-like receiver domain and a methylesterase domain [Halobacteroides halobius DSM 5150]
MASKIKVLVVDDSAFMRKVVSELLEEDREIEVIDKARNGRDALRKIEKHTPDVITLDVEMPKMNGLDFLKRLKGKKAIPVIMLSSITTEDSKATIKALELGAFDFISKPSGSISLDIEKVQDDLIEKVKLAAQTKVKRKLRRQFRSERKKKPKLNQQISASQESTVKNISNNQEKLVIIGASTGGPRAVKEVVSKLPADLNAAVLIVQHMPAGFTASLAQRLNKTSQLKVKEAQEGDRLEAGVALVAPGDYHMLIKNNKVQLTKGPKVHNVRPAIDKTIGSVVKEYQNQIVGVLLTGMGKDGAKGLKLIKEFGGQTIAQDEATSVVYGMPRVAFELGAVDSVKRIYKISNELVSMVNK